jgi:hypothetical protein
MKKACYFQNCLKVYDVSEHEALDRAVSIYRCKFRTKIIPSESENVSGGDFDVWAFINDILDGEEASDFSFTDCVWEMTPVNVNRGPPRLQRGTDLVSYYIRAAAAWRHVKTYRSIKKIFKKKVKRMSFEKALKYAIEKKKFEILRKLGSPLVHVIVGDESESKQNNILEDDIFGAEALFF